jgi:hypothetical protein
MADEAKVVTIRGDKVLLPGAPASEDVIDYLEKTLEMARSGEVQGVAIVRTHGDGCTTYHISGRRARGTLGAIELVKAEFVAELLAEK